jgi:hypothetical protein
MATAHALVIARETSTIVVAAPSIQIDGLRESE